jgi:hypothetical protein
MTWHLSAKSSFALNGARIMQASRKPSLDALIWLNPPNGVLVAERTETGGGSGGGVDGGVGGGQGGQGGQGAWERGGTEVERAEVKPTQTKPH